MAAITWCYPGGMRIRARRPITFTPGITAGHRFIIAIDPNVVRTGSGGAGIVSVRRRWRRADCNADADSRRSE